MNLVSALLGSAATTPDRPALLGPGGAITHGELAARVGRGAGGLGSRVGADDRVVIIAGNEPAFVVAYLACLAVGAVAVPCNPAAPAQELARELDVIEPELVVASQENGDRARRAIARH